MIFRRATATTVLVSIGVAAALLQACGGTEAPGTSTTRTSGSGATGSGTGGSVGAGGGNTGGSSTTGTGGTLSPPPINPGNPEAGADIRLGTDAACAGQSTKGEKKQTDLYMMMDNSGSMNEIDMGQTLSRWDNLAQAIPVFVNDPVNAGMQLGLDFFPEGGNQASCNIMDYTNANVPIDFIPGMNSMHSMAIIAAVNGRARSGGTPTTPALSGALQAAKAWQMTHMDRALSVLFLTDGEPTGCQGNNVNAAAAVAQTYANGTPPIKTFVLGVGPATGPLDSIAAAGGTMMAYMVTNGGAAALAAALASIRKSTLSCDYNIPLPEAGVLDPGKVTVSVRAGMTGAFVEIPNVVNANGCTNPVTGGVGWYYDFPPPAQTKIVLCPNSCGPLQIADGSEVSVLLGCVPKIIPPPN